MAKQVIVALGREFGSGGHEIARKLAARFQMPLYDENMLQQIAAERQGDASELQQYDEHPKNRLFFRTVNGFSNAPGDGVAEMQFQYMRERAESGESFVVLGRCAEEILREYPGLISIFVLADEGFKKIRTMEHGDDVTNGEEALALMAQTDCRRRNYHDQFCSGKWGEAATYDLMINSTRLGIEGTTDFLEQYIRARMALMEET